MKAVPVIQRTTDLPLQRNEMLALGKYGKFAVSTGFGFMKLGRSHLGETRQLGGILRRANTGYGRHGYSSTKRRKTIHVLMRTYAPHNPQTVPQQANRSKMTAAVAAWQSLTPEEKHNYNAVGAKRALPAYNAFISEYLKSH